MFKFDRWISTIANLVLICNVMRDRLVSQLFLCFADLGTKNVICLAKQRRRMLTTLKSFMLIKCAAQIAYLRFKLFCGKSTCLLLLHRHIYAYNQKIILHAKLACDFLLDRH